MLHNIVELFFAIVEHIVGILVSLVTLILIFLTIALMLILNPFYWFFAIQVDGRMAKNTLRKLYFTDLIFGILCRIVVTIIMFNDLGSLSHLNWFGAFFSYYLIEAMIIHRIRTTLPEVRNIQGKEKRKNIDILEYFHQDDEEPVYLAQVISNRKDRK